MVGILAIFLWGAYMAVAELARAWVWIRWALS